MRKTIDLLNYYRSQVNHPIDRSRPPAGFWIKEGKRGFVWGMLFDGDLGPEGKTSTYTEAVDACWAHYDTMHGKED